MGQEEHPLGWLGSAQPRAPVPLLGPGGQCPPWSHRQLRGCACVSGPPGQNVTMDEGETPLLPDSLVYQIFLSLGPADVLAAGLACRQWQAVSRDECLWREQFYRYYQVARDVPRHPGQHWPSRWLGTAGWAWEQARRVGRAAPGCQGLGLRPAAPA